MKPAPDFQLRPASPSDLDFAWPLYRDLMKPLTLEMLHWNEDGQKRTVEESLSSPGASIVLVNDAAAGWLHVIDTPGAIYLGQLYILPALQNLGIGAVIMRGLISRAQSERKTFTLDVMKNNRARLLYERLGFHTIETSQYKFRMQWQGGG